MPGYAVVGQVDALGDEVAAFAPGDRVAVLTEINGYAEYVYVRRNPTSGYRTPSTLQPPWRSS